MYVCSVHVNVSDADVKGMMADPITVLCSMFCAAQFDGRHGGGGGGRVVLVRRIELMKKLNWNSIHTHTHTYKLTLTFHINFNANG